MMKLPLSLRLTTGFVVLMIGVLLLCESLNFHFEYLVGVITVIAVLGATISLFIISRSHDQIDLSTVAPVLLESTLDALTEGVVLLDNRECIIIVNAAFADIIGTTPDSLKNIAITRFGWEFEDSEEVTEDINLAQARRYLLKYYCLFLFRRARWRLSRLLGLRAQSERSP